MIEGLRVVKNLPPAEVLETWLESEQGMGWEALEGGWEGHVARRKTLFEAQLGGVELEWDLYQIVDPERVIPHTLIGPYAGWQAFFKDSELDLSQRTFEEVIKVRKTIPRVGQMMQHYPQQVQFVGGVVSDSNVGWDRPFLLDGSHRAEAYCRRLTEGNPPKETRFFVALAQMTEAQRQRLYELRLGN